MSILDRVTGSDLLTVAPSLFFLYCLNIICRRYILHDGILKLADKKNSKTENAPCSAALSIKH